LFALACAEFGALVGGRGNFGATLFPEKVALLLKFQNLTLQLVDLALQNLVVGLAEVDLRDELLPTFSLELSALEVKLVVAEGVCRGA
jgi:hypothetical protein